MKRDFIWILAVLVLIGLLGLDGASLAAEDTWSRKTDMPTARFGFSTGVLNGKLYTIVGYTESNSARLSPGEEYDPATDTWTQKTSNKILYACIGAFDGAVLTGLASCIPIAVRYNSLTQRERGLIISSGVLSGAVLGGVLGWKAKPNSGTQKGLKRGAICIISIGVAVGIVAGISGLLFLAGGAGQ